MQVLRPAIFLDRDGVLSQPVIRNGRPFAPLRVEDFKLLDGAAGACERLSEAGFKLILTTNQPEIARGSLSWPVLEAMHKILRQQVRLDGIRVCEHDDSDRCLCRKPKPGMFVESAKSLGCDLKTSYAIGDRWRDIGAAHAAGCRAVFVDWNWNEPRPSGPYVVASSLTDATEFIVSNSCV